MLDAALEDGRVTKDERNQVENVATWLGVDVSDWAVITKAAKARRKAGIDAFRAEMHGKNVVFSGAGIHPQNIREALALKHGMIFSNRVVDNTDILVIGTDSTETLAVAQCRELGIPILIEAVFWRRLGEV